MSKLTNMLLAAAFIGVGATLRLLLCWANPPGNGFDDHFEPILLIMQNGAIPAKNACWQCYHPPVFYWISAQVGNVASALGLAGEPLLKLLQFLPCLYGILTLVLIHRILLKLPLTAFARLTALATACFLPRHIYMSAINSNDTISYLFVTLGIDLLLLAFEKRLALSLLAATSIVMSIALFTKYTAFVIFPVIVAAFAGLYWQRLLAPRPQIVRSFALVVLLPILVLGISLISNFTRYGTPLPWNVDQLDPSRTEPRDSARLDFLSFKPWESIRTPILVPGGMHSFWTLAYTGMWFDNEPKFLYFLDPNVDWWRHYYGWLRGEEPFPGESPSMGYATKIIGSALVALGLVPLLLTVHGVSRYLWSWKSRAHWNQSDKLMAVQLSILLALLLSNAAGIVVLAVRLPVYSATKASYLLNSLSGFAAFLACGVMPWETHRAWRWTISASCGVLFGLSSAHIVQIVHALLIARG